MKKKLITIVGARPQFIKASALSKEIKKNRDLNEVLIHTGQHFDSNMSKVFFEELDLDKPNRFLGISGGSHASMTGRMMLEIENVLNNEKPYAVIVFGDTNSTMAGALAASKLKVPVIHIEAGLRSFNLEMPEEINRVVTDHVSSLLLAPTQIAIQNLKAEGLHKEKLYCVGDLMYDVAIEQNKKLIQPPTSINNLNLKEKKFILTTIHRAENTDNFFRLSKIVSVILEQSIKRQVIWPLHPRTKAQLDSHGLLENLKKKVITTEPLSYLEMMSLQRTAGLILTDSGGVQKEAFFHRVPCVTVRDETEWTELITTGWNRLCPPLDESSMLHIIESAFGTSGKSTKLYGNGDAAKQIVSILEEYSF